MVFNHSADTSYEDIASQKLSFRKNIKLILTIDQKIRNEKIQVDINIEAAKVSTLSSSQN